MANENNLTKDREILRKNGFTVVGVKFNHENGTSEAGPYNSGFPAKTYTVGAGTFIIDGEGIMWSSPGDSHLTPEKIGLTGYEYCSLSYVLNPHAVK